MCLQVEQTVEQTSPGMSKRQPLGLQQQFGIQMDTFLVRLSTEARVRLVINSFWEIFRVSTWDHPQQQSHKCKKRRAEVQHEDESGSSGGRGGITAAELGQDQEPEKKAAGSGV